MNDNWRKNQEVVARGQGSTQARKWGDEYYGEDEDEPEIKEEMGEGEEDES